MRCCQRKNIKEKKVKKIKDKKMRVLSWVVFFSSSSTAIFLHTDKRKLNGSVPIGRGSKDDSYQEWKKRRQEK